MRPTVKLWELADLQNWYAFKSSDYISKSKTLNFRMSNIRPWWIVDIEYNKKFLPDEYAEIYKDFLLKDWDVVIAMTDMATSPKILAVPCIVNTWWYNVLLNQRVGKFFNVDETKIRKDFLWAVLSSSKIREGLASLWWWGLQINISKKQILDIQIPLPPLETQKAIVTKLDQIFAELDQTKSEIQKNLDNTDELWKSALNQAFQGGWEMKKLVEVCDKITDWSHNPPKWIEYSDYVMISSRNIDDWKIIFDDVRYLEKQDFDLEDKRTNVKEWDVLLSIVWTIWKVCVVKKEYWKFTMQRSVAVIKPIENKLYSYYLSYFLQAPIFQNIINENARWVAQKWIYLNSVKSLQIPVPPLSEQEKIVEHLDQVSNEVKALKSQYQSQLDNLEELKKSVLDKAFRWELGE